MIWSIPARAWLWLLPAILVVSALSLAYWWPLIRAIEACAVVRCL